MFLRSCSALSKWNCTKTFAWNIFKLLPGMYWRLNNVQCLSAIGWIWDMNSLLLSNVWLFLVFQKAHVVKSHLHAHVICLLISLHMQHVCYYVVVFFSDVFVGLKCILCPTYTLFWSLLCIKHKCMCLVTQIYKVFFHHI